MSHGFNTDKSNANIEDMIKIQKVDITMSAELPPYQDAEMGGSFNLSTVIPAGYKPVGVVGYSLPNATALRFSFINLSYSPYSPEIQYYYAYTVVNLNAGSGKKTFSIDVMLLKVTD